MTPAPEKISVSQIITIPLLNIFLILVLLRKSYGH